jgi:hypothetical protein
MIFFYKIINNKIIKLDEGITRKSIFPFIVFSKHKHSTVLYKCNMDLTKIRQWIVCLLMGLIFLYFFGVGGDL